MKNRLLALIGLLPLTIAAQTIMHSLPLELQRPMARQQLLLAPTGANGTYLVASDADRTYLLSYNRALFFRDSLSVPRPDREYTAMAGYSSDAESFTVYWTKPDFDKILAYRYNLSTRSVSKSVASIDYAKQTYLCSFSENNRFYIVTASDTTPSLSFYCFSNGNPEVRTVDLSSYDLEDTRGKKIKLHELLLASGLQKIDSYLPNPAASATGPVKLYSSQKGFVLTIDINRKQTQLFEMDPDFRVTQKTLSFPSLEGAERQNSFFHEGRLYQLLVAEEAMVLTCTDVATGTEIGRYNATADQDISFRNSPLLAQVDDSPPNQITGSKRFLRRLSGSSVGLTVYRSPEDLMVTIGGMRGIATAGDVFLGIAAGTAMVLGGGAADVGAFSDSSQFVFFDAVFDNDFRHKDMPPQLLSLDKIGTFAEEEELEGPSASAVFDHDVLFTYYDRATKQLILRRFRDGADE